MQHHLREQAAQHRKRPTKASPSPLAGKLFDENGAPLYAQGAMKDGRRYRYYVSRELVRGSARAGPGRMASIRAGTRAGRCRRGAKHTR